MCCFSVGTAEYPKKKKFFVNFLKRSVRLKLILTRSFIHFLYVPLFLTILNRYLRDIPILIFIVLFLFRFRVCVFERGRSTPRKEDTQSNCLRSIWFTSHYLWSLAGVVCSTSKEKSWCCYVLFFWRVDGNSPSILLVQF